MRSRRHLMTSPAAPRSAAGEPASLPVPPVAGREPDPAAAAQGPVTAAGTPAALPPRAAGIRPAASSPQPPPGSAAGPEPPGTVLDPWQLDTVLDALDCAAEHLWEVGDCDRCEPVLCDDHRADVARGIRYASLARKLRQETGR